MIDKDEEKLYNITMNTQNNNEMIVSNHVGVDGESVDRIYGDPNSGKYRLVQRDYTTYKGTINKKMTMVNGLGVSIVSTSKGVMTGKQASLQDVGGELLCYVY